MTEPPASRKTVGAHKQRCAECAKLFHTKDDLYRHCMETECVSSLWTQFKKTDYFKCPECDFNTISFTPAVVHCKAKHPTNFLELLKPMFPEVTILPCGKIISTKKAVRKHQKNCSACPELPAVPPPIVSRPPVPVYPVLFPLDSYRTT